MKETIKTLHSCALSIALQNYDDDKEFSYDENL